MQPQSFAVKPKENEPWDVIIVGSGPAGLTAAIYTTRGAASTLILGGEKWGGQLMLTTDVDNFPGFPDGVQGPELMTMMRRQAERFGAEFLEKNIDSVDFSQQPYKLIADGVSYLAKSVILATGAETKWLGVPGEEKLRGRGVSSCAPCDAPFFKDKNVIVVGGGDSAMEEALVLTKYAHFVTIVHRRDSFRASAAMQQKVFEKQKEGKLDIIWETEVIEMVGEEKLERVRLKTGVGSKQAQNLRKGDYLEKKGGRIIREDDSFIYWEAPIEGLFVAIGHIPATAIFGDDVEKDQKGYIVVRDHTKTNIEGVFAAGDVHDYHYRQAITAAGFGCMAAMDALKYLDKQAAYW